MTWLASALGSVLDHASQYSAAHPPAPAAGSAAAAAAAGPVLHRASVLADTARHALVTRLPAPADCRWTLHQGNATESHTVYTILGNREILFWQLAHSNLGWSPTVQISARYFKAGPDGCNIFKSITVPTASFTLSADRRSVTVEGGSATLSADGSEYTVRFRPADPAVERELSFELKCRVDTAGYKIGEGRNYFDTVGSSEYVAHSTLPSLTVVSGHIMAAGQLVTLDDGAGRALVSHALIATKPHLAATQWNMAYFSAGAVALYLLQFDTPVLQQQQHGAAPRSETVAQGCLVLDGKLRAVTVRCEVIAHTTKPDPDTGYAPPVDIEYRWSGTTNEGGGAAEAFSASVRRPVPNTLVDKVDVLAELPFLVRKAIQVFVTKPYCYQWLESARAEITVGERRMDVEGSLFHECTFLN